MTTSFTHVCLVQLVVDLLRQTRGVDEGGRQKGSIDFWSARSVGSAEKVGTVTERSCNILKTFSDHHFVDTSLK